MKGWILNTPDKLKSLADIYCTVNRKINPGRYISISNHFT